MEAVETNKHLGKRTGIDFSNHELKVHESDMLTIHYLKVPDTIMDSVKFVNTQGICAVTGDYSNWIFCRPFIPSAKGGASDGYWKEKLKISSCQEPSKYDSEKTLARIKEMLEDEDLNLNEEDIEYLNDLSTRVDDELEYTYYAYKQMPSNWDYETIPFCKSVNVHFSVILDAFDEICRRLKDNEPIVTL